MQIQVTLNSTKTALQDSHKESDVAAIHAALQTVCCIWVKSCTVHVSTAFVPVCTADENCSTIVDNETVIEMA